jgi:hypothetical protein
MIVYFSTKNGVLYWALVAHVYNSIYLRSRDQDGCSLRPPWAKSKTLSQKYLTQKGLKKGWKSGSSGKHDALSSNPSTAKKEWSIVSVK